MRKGARFAGRTVSGGRQASNRLVYDLLGPWWMKFAALFIFLIVSGLRALSADQSKEQEISATHPLRVKVVVLTMFELGADSGDQPGEFQFWVERRKMDQVIPLPAAYHAVRADGMGVIATVTGMGIARAASSVMALGLDPRFDFSQAYWLVAGIAGINPETGSVGSAVWSDYVVDADLAYEIDGREIPPGWQTGRIPLNKSEPFATPREHAEGELFALNRGLAEWAFTLTKTLPLPDTDKLRDNRNRYVELPAAQTPPKILLGTTLAGSTYWHGKMLNQWATQWVRYWTDGQGAYATTEMEDTGTLQALTFLAKAGRVDLRRVMVLRTASNFDSPPPGVSAADDLADEQRGHYSAYFPSLEAAFQVGNRVVTELVDHWDDYAKQTPGGALQ